MKRPYRIQWLIRTFPTEYETINGAFGNLQRTIREAKRLKADRVIDLRDKRVVWSKVEPEPTMLDLMMNSESEA